MGEAAEEATEQGVQNMVAFNYRFIPAIRLARKLILEGAIGELYQ